MFVFIFVIYIKQKIKFGAMKNIDLTATQEDFLLSCLIENLLTVLAPDTKTSVTIKREATMFLLPSIGNVGRHLLVGCFY